MMSFLVAIGYIMEGSGLCELLEVITSNKAAHINTLQLTAL